MPASVTVRVPATVANLGPAFDALGAAVSLHLEIHLEPRRQSIDVTLDGEGAGEVPTDASNLVVSSMNAFFDHVGRRPPGFAIHIKNPIPLASGLGSSAAAVVGGLVAARAVTGAQVPQTEMVQLATELEGHPDNVMPALLGGLVVCYRTDGELRYMRMDPSDRLVPMICVPRRGFATAAAREGLPTTVSFADAQHSASRAALLVGAVTLGAGADLLADAMTDRLHEPYRLAQMPDSALLHEELRATGIPVALAGAGPSLLLIVPRPEAATRAEQIRRVLRARDEGWRLFVLEWEAEGATSSP